MTHQEIIDTISTLLELTSAASKSDRDKTYDVKPRSSHLDTNKYKTDPENAAANMRYHNSNHNEKDQSLERKRAIAIQAKWWCYKTPLENFGL
jgi:hypothetical protein